MEAEVQTLELKKQTALQRLKEQHHSIRSSLLTLRTLDRVHHYDSTFRDVPSHGKGKTNAYLPAQERMIRSLLGRSLEQVRQFKQNYADALHLEKQLQGELQHLKWVGHEAEVKSAEVELDQSLGVSLSRSSVPSKSPKKFSARHELESAQNWESHSTQSFASLKGKLPYPVSDGKLISSFGKVFDSSSGLYVFKKGVELKVGKARPVQAIAAGQVAFSGVLPHYGNVVIVDHGDHFYSLVGHLGKVLKKVRDPVSPGAILGQTSEADTPLYFEIRSRNVAVNPLQWVLN